ncbi:MAG: tyrosine-protein phosphatase [Hyphomonadaceae bacterium]|nr:tyrosine-protein phosphatase [Hyphomonadaceae bacterium]
MNDRIHTLEGVRNFRDFGGYTTGDGRTIKRGLLFRSGHYNEATEADIAWLENLKIQFQADLRRPDERERQPGKWSAPTVLTSDGGREMQSPHVTFLSQVEANVEEAEDWMNTYYVTAPFKPHHVELFTGWFDHLAGLEGEVGALVNCAAGKDRTGIICALTKHVLGVSRGDILSDYEMTNIAVDIDARLPDAQRYFNDMLGKAYAADVYRPFLGVRRRFLETAFDTIEKEAGSVDAYLEGTLGVTQEMRDAMKARLLT